MTETMKELMAEVNKTLEIDSFNHQDIRMWIQRARDIGMKTRK